MNMNMKMNVNNPKPISLNNPQVSPLPKNISFKAFCVRRNIESSEKLVHEFDPKIAIEEAVTPPSSWYTNSDFLARELQRIFYTNWQAIGHTEQIKDHGDFFTGRLGNVEFMVCRDNDGVVRAFHSVCRHRASPLAHGSGKKSCFVCPYHGWTYGLNGSFLKATKLEGIQNFNVNVCGIRVSSNSSGYMGTIFLLKVEPKQNNDVKIVANEWLGSASEILDNRIVNSSLTHIIRREYIIECNWKVFCDNYIDGGYHVPFAHKDFTSDLKMDTYSTTVFEKGNIQKCEGNSSQGKADYDRLGPEAFYAFVYPNFMIGMYGPWMDTNLVLPLGPNKWKVVFDYFLETSRKDDKAFVDRSLEDSEKVQIEDMVICEGVQKGLESPAYSVGRYVPSVEHAVHHFHAFIHSTLTN